MARASLPNGIELEYDAFGSPDDPTLLLIMGLTAQMTAWEDEFCKALAGGGRHVVRFDNRDCGLSTQLDEQRVDIGAVMAAALAGEAAPPVPYTLSDMAADAVGLLDHLGVESAHVMGASMGGMIAQTVAIEHPSRCRTLVSVMSNTGEPEFGQPTQEAAASLLAPPPTDRDAYIEASSRWLVWQSKRYADHADNRAKAARNFDRAFRPYGAPRQLAAIYASGSRAAGLRALATPTLVIHGRDDTLITPSGGERTAELVQAAHLMLLGDMGHDFPEPLWPIITSAVLAHTAG
jgi:pimeloyl-ACP methyl ester carboxylesterase